MMRWFPAICLAALPSITGTTLAGACTAITLTAADGSVVRGQTLEFVDPKGLGDTIQTFPLDHEHIFVALGEH